MNSFKKMKQKKFKKNIVKNSVITNSKNDDTKFTKWYHKNIELYTLSIAVCTLLIGFIPIYFIQKQTSIAAKSFSEQLEVNKISKNNLTVDSINKFKERALSLISDNSIDTLLKKEILNKEIKDITNLINYNPQYLTSFLSVISLIKIRNITIPKLHIIKQNINDISLKNVVFQELKLEGINIKNVNFENCIFLNSSFFVCQFDNSNFNNCNLVSPNFYACNFSTWSILSGSITNAIFNYIGAGGVIFKSSNLNSSKFYGWFHSADFSNCDLRNCVFYKCNLAGANFDNSDLRASTFEEVQFEADDPMSKLGEMTLTAQPLGERDTLVAKIDFKTGHSTPSDTIGGLSVSIDYPAGKKMIATFKRAKMGNVKWIDGRIFCKDSIGK